MKKNTNISSLKCRLIMFSFVIAVIVINVGDVRDRRGGMWRHIIIFFFSLVDAYAGYLQKHQSLKCVMFCLNVCLFECLYKFNVHFLFKKKKEIV